MAASIDQYSNQTQWTREQREGSDSDTASSTCSLPKYKRGRKRKTCRQLALLREEFFRNPNWKKADVAALSKKIGLSEVQVYKWGWDFKKKLKQEGTWISDTQFNCEETLGFNCIDLVIWNQQCNYRKAYADSFDNI